MNQSLNFSLAVMLLTFGFISIFLNTTNVTTLTQHHNLLLWTE